MSRLGISTGSSPNSGTGDTLLSGGIKINANFSEIYANLGDGTDLKYSVQDGIRCFSQPSPAGLDATTTLTIENIKSGIVTSSTPANVTLTLPTGTNTQSGFTTSYNNFAFEWSAINLGSTNSLFIQENTNHTSVGSTVISPNSSGRFLSRRVSNNTFTTYRVS